MKQIIHDIGLTLVILISPISLVIKLLVILCKTICKAFVIVSLLIVHYLDYIIHYKAYRDGYQKLKKDWEKLFSDYENGAISISIDYPKD